jgi:hypothetical protein
MFAVITRLGAVNRFTLGAVSKAVLCLNCFRLWPLPPIEPTHLIMTVFE